MEHVDRRQVIQAVMGSALPAVGSGTATAHLDTFSQQEEPSAEPDENKSTIPTATEDWESIQPRDHLTFYYKNGYSEDAELVAEYYTDAEDFAKDELPDDIPVEYEVPVFVTPASEWDRSDHLLYWANPPIEVHLQAPSDSPNDERWHRTGLAHELYNIVLWKYYDNSSVGYRYRDRNPSWFAEGFSEYLAARQPSTNDGYPNAGLQNLMEQIQEGNGYFATVAENQYHGGHLICEYLLGTEGINYQDFFNIIRNDSQTWSQALEEEFDMSHFEMNLGWLQWAEENIGGDFSTPLVTAANQLRTGNVNTETLREVIEVWRSGKPLQ